MSKSQGKRPMPQQDIKQDKEINELSDILDLFKFEDFTEKPKQK